MPRAHRLGFQGTTFTAGSLHAPLPALLMARTRAHTRLPLVRPGNVAADFVTVSAVTKLVSVIGSGLICTS